MLAGYAEARNIVFHEQLDRSHDITMKNLLTEDKETTLGEAATTRKAMGRLFFLEASDGGRIRSANADGSDRKVIVTGCRIPDGIVVDVNAGHIYWTNMGVPNRNDGSIERADLHGQNRKTIVPEGATFTPKQARLCRSRALHGQNTTRNLSGHDRPDRIVAHTRRVPHRPRSARLEQT
jgi:hypothetical protein